MFPDDVGILGQCGLGAGLKAEASCREHHVLDEHAAVDPRASFQNTIDKKVERHRGIEAVVVFHPLLLTLFDVVPLDV